MNQSLFVFFVSGCKLCQYCSIHRVPLTVIKFLTIFIFVEFMIKRFFQSCSPRTGFISIHDAFTALSVANVFLIRYLYVKSQSIASANTATFWRAFQAQTQWVIFEPASQTHHLGLKAQNFENPIFTFGCFSLKAVYQSICTLNAPEILLFKVFINACQLTGEMPIDWSFFFGVCQYLYQIEIYLDYQYSESFSNKNLALHWQ